MQVLLGILLGLVLVVLAVMVLVWGKPLRENEVAHLANKRRMRQILKYFSFPHLLSYADSKFKSTLKPDGALYPADIEVRLLPSYVGSLLKYKKHEWIVIAFVRERKCIRLWANKGVDRNGVAVALPVEHFGKIAKANGCEILMVFHNHPASRPDLFRYDLPSSQDVQSADSYATVLNAQGISSAEYVCERGHAYRYALHPAQNLFPEEDFRARILLQNGWGIIYNILLHLELFLG